MLLKSEYCDREVLQVDAVGAICPDHVQLALRARDDHVVGGVARALDLEVALHVADPVAVRVPEDRDQVLRVRALAVLVVGQRARVLVRGLAAGRRGAVPVLEVLARHHHDALTGPAPLVDRGLDAAVPTAGQQRLVVAPQFARQLLDQPAGLGLADNDAWPVGPVFGERAQVRVGEERRALGMRAGTCRHRERDQRHHGEGKDAHRRRSPETLPGYRHSSSPSKNMCPSHPTHGRKATDLNRRLPGGAIFRPLDI